MKKDTLSYINKKGSVQKGSFLFSEEVANVFLDMARRSIPGYDEQQEYIARYISAYITHSSSLHPTIIDYGCSLGRSLSVFTEYARKKQFSCSHVRVILSDYSIAMLDACRKITKKDASYFFSVEYVSCDLRKKEDRKKISSTADVGILHFVLQFLPFSKRYEVLFDIWNTIASPGVLIVSEKIYSEVPSIQEVWEGMYNDFKIKNGYSQKEVLAKRKALEGVLVPSTERELQSLFISLMKNGNRCEIDNFFSWGPFHCFALHKL